MSNGALNWIAYYIWGIAADVLRDLYVRGKYRDVKLPMTVLRHLHAVLEGSKQAATAALAPINPCVRWMSGRDLDRSENCHSSLMCWAQDRSGSGWKQ